MLYINVTSIKKKKIHGCKTHFLFFPSWSAFGIWISLLWPGAVARPSAATARSPKHWTATNSPSSLSIKASDTSPFQENLLVSTLAILAFNYHNPVKHRFYFFPSPFTDEETEAQRNWINHRERYRMKTASTPWLLCFKANSLFTSSWWEELTHLKRPWCWERVRAGGEGDDRGWDGWMASLTQWTRVWVNSGSWWWTGRPGVLQFTGLQRVRHDLATELNWSLEK